MTILKMTNTTMSKSYKIFQPKFGADELEAVKEVFKSGILTQGPKVEELEKEFAEYVGAPYAVAVNSCTSAIFLCLQYLKIKLGVIQHESLTLDGDNAVMIPSVTFISVANAIVNSGLKVHFYDDIHVGEPYYLTGTTIVDSAHYLERNCYKHADDLMCFSFYPTKLLGSCEGGMIALSKEEAYKWLRKARANGMERKGMFDWDYTVDFTGWKMMMNDIQAAIALTRLKKLDKFNEKRKQIRDFYNSVFDLDNQSLHVYPILVNNREELAEKLKENNIGFSLHFKPIHLQPAYADPKSLPESEEWGRTSISIPLHENLTLKDAKFIANIVKKYAVFCRSLN